MKIVSWNVNSLRVRLDVVLEWIRQHQPTVLCLQELKMPDEEFPQSEFEKLGYHCAFTGQKTYNGVATLSLRPLENIQRDLPDYTDPMRRYLSTDVIVGGEQSVRVINVYCPNGQSLDSDKFVYKREWFEKLRLAMHQHLIDQPNTILLGDFNITPTDLDVHDVKQWQGKIHCSELERLMLQKLMAEGLYDTFRQFHSEGERFSWWDYRGAGYRANAGLRIDLVLASAPLLERAIASDIDEEPRKLERPSDHTPVWTEFTFA